MTYSNNSPTPYADLNGVLRALITGVSDILGKNFVGLYLQGSFAVGDYDVYSDVDFVAVLNEEISPTHLPTLQAFHGDIFDLPSAWAQHLEGSYIPKDALRHLPPPHRKFLYLDNGSRELIRSDHDDSLVVYWILRERGVTLVGPQPASLVAPVPGDALRLEILETMRTWREHLLTHPAQLDSRWRQTFVVLSYCRMLHTLQTGAVESKRAGVGWAQATLERRWRPLIQRAWNDRPGDVSLKVCEKANPDDLQSTWDFIRYAVNAELARRGGGGEA